MRITDQNSKETNEWEVGKKKKERKDQQTNNIENTSHLDMFSYHLPHFLYILLRYEQTQSQPESELENQSWTHSFLIRSF